jgi:hypothetical protein
LRFSTVVRTGSPEVSVIPAPRQTTPAGVRNQDFFAVKVPSAETKSIAYAPCRESQRTPPTWALVLNGAAASAAAGPALAVVPGSSRGSTVGQYASE